MSAWNPFEYFKNVAAIDYESFLRGAEAYQEWLSTQPDQRQVGVDECIAGLKELGYGAALFELQSLLKKRSQQ